MTTVNALLTHPSGFDLAAMIAMTKEFA